MLIAQPMNLKLTLRPSQAEDEAFLYQVYASRRAAEMALADWPEAQKVAFLHMQFNAQRQAYARQFPAAVHQIILCDAVASGRLMLNRTEAEILLVDIVLLPAFRNQGIGTQLLQALQKEAEATGKVLRLHVERFNPAQQLYTRLGFTKISQSDIYLEMVWQPPSMEGTVDAGKSATPLSF
jgi:ribosomal protein S18 acetylase RimI-like enzyme